jgi:hypothetical protein
VKPLLVFLVSFIVLVILGNLGLPQFFSHPVYDRDPGIDLAFTAQIELEHPDVIVMGNSLIERGLNFDLLQKSIGLAVMRMSSGGSGSALWYLFLKNQIAVTTDHPRYVVIIFKDNVFSVPNISVDGKYQEIIDQYAGLYEPVLDRLAYSNYLSPFHQFLEKNLAWFRYNPVISQQLVEMIRTPLVTWLFGSTSFEIDEAVGKTFAVENLDPGLATRIQQQIDLAQQLDANYDFQENLKDTFLPSILEIARKKNIHLIFVAYRARHYVEYPDSERRNRNYLADMGAYITSQGATFIDFTHDQRLRFEHFAEGDHLNGEGRVIFTAMLANSLQDVIKSTTNP